MKTDNFQASNDLSLTSHDPRDLDGYAKDKSAGKKQLTKIVSKISDLQTVFHAENQRSLLLVFQGMDTSGKDGTIKGVFSDTNPLGLKIKNFKKPTSNEVEHDYLWRVHHALPERGQIGLFNRSHYEDVLVTRVNDLITPEKCTSRYSQIFEFEKMLHQEGTKVVKFFLNISPEEQKQRLQERLDNPNKHWKFSAADIEARKKWHSYIDAYENAIRATHSEDAPWYIVPADSKWFRNLVVAQVVLETLQSMNPQFPEVDFIDGDIVIPDV